MKPTVLKFLRENRALLLLLAAGLLLRLAVALPGLCGDAEQSFSRPDTPGYLGPARALATEGEYLDEPGGAPNSGRAPGFPLFAAAVFKLSGSDQAGTLAVSLLLLNALIPLAVYWGGTVWTDRKTALWACGLIVFNLTMIAQAPMLLTDTLFGLVAALMLGCYGKFHRLLEPRWFLLTLILAGIGALIRPINSVWVLPALFLLAVTPKFDWKRKLATGAAGLAVFLLILLPWMGRNAALGAGWCIDTNTGAMYHQNGAMILAQVNGSSFEEEKARMIAEIETEFADTTKYPDQKSRSDYRIQKFKELIFAHPFVWISQHFRPHVLLPDAPTFLEILGVTSAGRGTMDVMQREGVFAAAKHYFDGKLWVIFPLLPLLGITLALYGLAAWRLGYWVVKIKTHWFCLFLFLAFVEYFFFLPGPITAPRYQLPALPLLALMAAQQLPIFWNMLQNTFVRKKTKESLK